MIVFFAEVSAEGILEGRQPNFDNRQGTVGVQLPECPCFASIEGYGVLAGTGEKLAGDKCWFESPLVGLS